MSLSFINIRIVPGVGFQHFPAFLASVNEWQVIFGPYIAVQIIIYKKLRTGNGSTCRTQTTGPPVVIPVAPEVTVAMYLADCMTPVTTPIHPGEQLCMLFRIEDGFQGNAKIILARFNDTLFGVLVFLCTMG